MSILMAALVVVFTSFSMGAVWAQTEGSGHFSLNELSPMDYAGLLALYTADRSFFESTITADENASDPFLAKRKQGELIDQILGSIEVMRTKYVNAVSGDVAFLAEYQEDLKFDIEQMTFRFCLPTGVGGSPVSFMHKPLTIYVNVSLDYGRLFDGWPEFALERTHGGRRILRVLRTSWI